MEKKFLEYSEYPKTFIQYTNSTILINYDIVQSTRTIEDKEEIVYTSKCIIVNKIDKDNIVDALIRDKYSLSQELATLRQRDTKPEEYSEYNDYAEGCKRIADSILKNEYI